MAGHAQLKFVMTECSKTQIRLTGLIYYSKFAKDHPLANSIVKYFERMYLINYRLDLKLYVLGKIFYADVRRCKNPQRRGRYKELCRSVTAMI